MRKILIVGAGFSGAVLAQQLAKHSADDILVVDERSHVGGHCHTERHDSTGVMIHVYGPHIFNTSNETIWHYVQQFGKFNPFINRVKAVTSRGVYSLPINLLTINQLFGKAFNPREAEAFVKGQAVSSIGEPRNLEEQALKYLGQTLYETFFRGYTIKQWGVSPKELPAAILKRLPVRFTYDDTYYNNIYQGIPVEGYTTIISRMLSDSKISVALDQKYDKSWNKEFDYVFYSGAIDAYFKYRLGRLGYRTIHFESEIFPGPDYQGNPVINYCDEQVAYTRIHEHRHFAPWEEHKHSVYFREFSKETGDDDVPFYPKRLQPDVALLKKYRDLAETEEKVSFIGRLGTYRYLDMQHVVKESLDLARQFMALSGPLEHFPKFPNAES
jgi:UDP-galactopyranose mutase